jgi:threonine dehydratase
VIDPPDLGGAVTLERIEEAHLRLRPHVRRTPLERSEWLSRLIGGDVHLKLECLQRTGSFKVRGALNAVATLGAEARGRGVVTASAGNHGLGVALASRLHAVPCTIFLPATAAAVKRERIARMGATVRTVAGGYDAAHEEALRHARAEGLAYVHAFSEPAVVAGQGTVALEVLEALPDVRTIVVPVGGGGLLGGVGIAVRALAPYVRIVGVQSEATAAMHASWHAGALRSVPEVPTLCDGLSGDVDAASLALALRVLDEIRLVGERGIAEAIRDLYYEEGVSAEGSGAVGVAALREGLLTRIEGPVAVLVSGGNLDASRLVALLRHPDGKR